MMKWISLLALLAGCHAHQVASDHETLKSPPKTKQVSSERPVRTTPGAMLDLKAMREIQRALTHHGEPVGESGQLDRETQAALERFQRKQAQPATGIPDYDTLRRLGLDPKKIYLGGTARREAKAR